MSERDDGIIAQYTIGDDGYACLIRDVAKDHGGIDRVENGKYIFADGFRMSIKCMTLTERWAEEMESRPANWLRITDE